MKKLIVWLLLSLASVFAFQALAQQAVPSKKPAPAATAKVAASDNSNISAPGPEGGSCSATSTDGNKTCSISCAKGKSANCSNTKTTVSCKCTP